MTGAFSSGKMHTKEAYLRYLTKSDYENSKNSVKLTENAEINTKFATFYLAR